MSKKAEETEPRHRDADRTVTAIKPGPFDKLVTRLAAVNRSMKDDRTKKSELMKDAVEDGLHKGAFTQFMKLRDMDPVKRNEWLFHFELYCERGNFTREELFLRTADDAPRETDGDDEGRDMRPRHLRQPGASAAEAVQKLAEESGAKTRPDEDNLRGVGRGKQNPESPKLN